MCPVPTTSRPPELMKEEVFTEVVAQAGAESGFILLPQGFGETFLHPRWADFLGRARAKGIGPIVLLTNGMLLDSRNVERILALEIDGLLVSIDGVTQETYGSVRVGGNLAKVEANVMALLAARGERPRPHLALSIIRMSETEGEVEAFLERWRARVGPSDMVLINEYNDWPGRSTTGGLPRDRPRARTPGPMPDALAQPLGPGRRQGLRLLPRQRGRADRR